MATNGWNLAHFGRDQSRPYQTSSSSTMTACRICDKLFPSTRSLLDHYESHQGDFVNQRQNQIPQRPYTWDIRRERSTSFQQRGPQQRPHPYFPNGYPATSSFHVPTQNTFLVPTQNPFLVPTQNLQMTHPRSHLVISGSGGRNSGAGDSHLVINRPEETPPSPLGPPVRLEYQKGYDETADKRTKWYQSSGTAASHLVINRPEETPGSLLGSPVRLEYQKGYDETADKRTKWYLGQLERPIPKIINQGNRTRSHGTSYRF